MKILFLAKFPQIFPDDTNCSSFPGQYFGYYAFKKMGADITWYSQDRSSLFWKICKRFPASEIFCVQFSCVRVAKQYDVIYVGEDFHLLILALLRCLHIIKIPVFAISHFSYNTSCLKSFFKRSFIRLERHFVYKYIDRLCFASESLLKEADKDYIIPSRHHNYCNWGANLAFFDISIYKKEEPTEAFFLSSGGNNRDYDLLIKCFTELPNEKLVINARYKPINDNVSKNIYIEKKMNFNIEDHINQRTQMFNCIAVLLPIKEFNQVPNGATLMIEAIAMGKPIVISRLSTNLIDVEKEGIGLTVELGDINGWVEAIKWLKDHVEERKKMGERALALAQKKYNINNFAKHVYDQLEDLVVDYSRVNN